MLYFWNRIGMKIVFIFFSVILSACKTPQEGYSEINAPAEIAERAFRFAELYEEADTEYDLGGQDAVRSAIKIDCSGLVIMSYKYALVDTKYQLLESDMTAAYMYDHCTHTSKEQARKGDLIFMGETDSTSITHIALFEKAENGNIYFIDSTLKDTDGDGVDDINGVTRRFYSETDKRLKSYGIMRLKY